MKKQKGFSLIELLIVVAIILIIAAIAIPNFMKSKMAANEASAVGSIRTINTSEIAFASACPDQGFTGTIGGCGIGAQGFGWAGGWGKTDAGHLHDGGGLAFLRFLFEGGEHDGGEVADGFRGAEIGFTTAHLVDDIGQQVGHHGLVRFQGAQQERGQIGDGLGDADVDLAAAQVVDGYRQQFEDIASFLQADGGEIRRQHNLRLHLASADLSALFAGVGLFLLLVGIVEETIVFAGLGIGLAAGANLADVFAAGLFVA